MGKNKKTRKKQAKLPQRDARLAYDDVAALAKRTFVPEIF